MSKVILYSAMSLDGYIADAEDSVDWLDDFVIEGQDFGYGAMISRIGTIVMGAATYRFVAGAVAWPYTGQKTYVLTRGTLDAPNEHNVEAFNGDVRALVARIRAESEQDIWLAGGGQVNALFAAADLIDEYDITVMPVLLGQGTPLFADFAATLPLTFWDVKPFVNGVLQMRYVRELEAS